MANISVIVPVYKVESFLSRCVDSILNQTYSDFELVLIEDGSPDQSGAICDEYAQKDDRFRVVHQANAGVSSARNVGLNNVHGEWITFLDADDRFKNNALEFYTNHISESIDMIMAGYMSVDEETLVKQSIYKKENR